VATRLSPRIPIDATAGLRDASADRNLQKSVLILGRFRETSQVKSSQVSSEGRMSAFIRHIMDPPPPPPSAPVLPSCGFPITLTLTALT
jgi:hypothetical protein